ncbi:substrate-binding domain-containing protein [Nocardia sp. NEAU-G5]|uniref:Substrate-binding domain-containing protein n=2 Tax=Nocardia albiluteola TaxID=2842303 RepID=A0ABS6BEW3_9NOCA|nr:substrate-binding domain-containing protein [Nocardia albiluteola]
MQRRFLSLVAAGVLTVLAVSGCGPAGSGGAGGSGKKLTVGLIMLQGDEYFRGIQTSLEAAVKADGGTVIAANSNNDAGAEAAAAQNMIQRQVDAIIMQPVTVAGSLATMKSIKGASIPLICYGNCTADATSPSVVKGVVQSDNTALGTATGKAAAEYIKSKLGGSARIGILNCDSAAETCKLRKAGFKKALQDAGVTATYASDQEGFLADKATTVATNMLSGDPGINLLWAANEGGTVGEVTAVGQSGKTIPVFGTDISKQLAGFLQDNNNILQATTGQDPQTTAKDAFEQAKNAVAGKANSPLETDLPGITYTRDDPAAVNKYLGK